MSWLGSGNLLVRRRVFEAVGGFDTTLETCEDVDLCRRVRRHGLILSDDRLRNVHWGDPATLRALFMAELWRGRDNFRVSMREGAWQWLSPSVFMPMLTLSGLGLLVLSLVLADTSRVIVATIGFMNLLATFGARATAMSLGTGGPSMRDLRHILAVAGVYELARALALLGLGGYSGRRSARVEAR